MKSRNKLAIKSELKSRKTSVAWVARFYTSGSSTRPVVESSLQIDSSKQISMGADVFQQDMSILSDLGMFDNSTSLFWEAVTTFVLAELVLSKRT